MVGCLLVKVAKKTLKAVVGNAGLTDDELQPAIKEVEALMNSRLLTYEGADRRDEPVLTPNHFLVGELGGQLAPHVTDDIAFNPRNRWRLVQNLVKLFWKQWREEFLSTLNMQKKWREAKDNLKVGDVVDVVLVVDQNAPCGQWCLGRVEEVFPGQHGQVRVQVSTKGQKRIRPITRLCPLNVAGQAEYGARDLERRAQDLEPLLGRGGDGQAINLNLFVCKCQALSPCGD